MDDPDLTDNKTLIDPIIFKESKLFICKLSANQNLQCISSAIAYLFDIWMLRDLREFYVLT